MFVMSSKNAERVVKKWPVIIGVAQDGGRVTKHQIHIDYLVISDAEVAELRMASLENGTSVDADLLRRVVRGIHDVQDEDGNPLEYSEELLEDLIAMRSACFAMAVGYHELANGQKAKAKN